MVMKNADTGRSKTDLPALYDELEAKIRALESLGRTQEKFGDFLSPLVEKGWESNVEFKHTNRNSGETSVLGIIWNLDEDTLMCKIDLEILSCRTKINKRLILSTVQKLYDLIGVLTPTALLPKLIILDLWKSHFSWDEELPPSVVNWFSKWLNEMYLLKDVTLSRFMNFNETSELHVFVDESVDGELVGEESNSNNVTDNENNVTSVDAVIVRKLTSSESPYKT
ncbi:integrase catalytic domain-containing protein [Nephila pilipes]|uniref:Integrase catalytic domain-containing protein n=1 Tax=Nephila pilipes TaxID=299642 RepID=A0A8X6QJL9_NEPPI|nr:integrase catalytic domain-containing protein [Nephila pilipes]